MFPKQVEWNEWPQTIKKSDKWVCWSLFFFLFFFRKKSLTFFIPQFWSGFLLNRWWYSLRLDSWFWQHVMKEMHSRDYRQTSNVKRTTSQHSNVSRFVTQLSLPDTLKPSVRSIINMQMEQHRQAMLQLHLNEQQCYCLSECGLYYKFDGNISRT